MHDCRHKSLYRAAVGSFVVAWVVLCSPWLEGQLTIPYDAKAHFQAQLQFLANALHTNQSPFWAPNVFAGLPQIADPQSLIFSPAILIAYFSPEPSFALVDAYVLGMLGCAGCAMLLLFRDRGWHPIGAVVAALAFAFGASAAWRVQHVGQVQSYSLFAISLWLLARALERSSGAWGAAAGLSIGIMIVEPNQVALLAAYILLAFIIASILRDRSPLLAIRRAGAPVGSAVAIALMVASVPVVLTYLFVEESNRPAIALDAAVRASLHPASLLTAVVGDLFGALDPTVDYWGPYSTAWDPSNSALSQNMSQLYAGAIPVILLLTVGFVRRLAWSAEIRFYTLALLAMLVYALGGFTPLFYIAYRLVPGVDLFRRPADATFFVGGLLAVLGGYLVHAVIKGEASSAPPALRSVEAGIIALVFAAAVLVAVRLGHLRYAIKPIIIAAACVGTAGLTLWLARRFSSQHPLMCLALCAAVMTGDLRWNNGPNESTALSVARYDFLKRNCKNETIRLLKALLKQPTNTSRRDRVELVGLGFEWPNVGLIHGFDHDLGYNPLRIDAVSKAIGAGDTIAGWDQRHFTPLFPSYNSLLANMLGLRYIASAVPIEQVDKKLEPGDLVQIARTKDAYVYENPRSLPHVMFVSGWQLADFNTLIETGRWPEFDPTKTVLLEKDPPFPGKGPSVGSSQPAGAATIAHYENTIVEIDVTASRSGFVVLNSAWHPWWRATVDGKATDVLKANVLFRAVQVSAGKHRIRFDFEPFVGAIAEIVRLAQKSVSSPFLTGASLNCRNSAVLALDRRSFRSFDQYRIRRRHLPVAQKPNWQLGHQVRLDQLKSGCLFER
jgi:hypothetical protein